jgi:putative hydrolase of the HAD superfamily
MLEILCFDLDGTLYDDRQYVYAGFVKAAEYVQEHFNISILDDLMIEYFENENCDTVFDVVIEHHGLPDAVIPKLVKQYHRHDATLAPYPDVLPVFQTLAKDYRLAVISDGRNGREKLTRLGIRDILETVVISPNHGISKRDPDPFQMVADRLNANVETMLYVGDNPDLDFEWPAQLGITTVWIRRPSILHPSKRSWTEPDYEIDNLWELKHTVIGKNSYDGGTFSLPKSFQ